jgi:hypothetical protein
VSFSVARFTTALSTPSSSWTASSTVDEQEAQLMPPMDSVTSLMMTS